MLRNNDLLVTWGLSRRGHVGWFGVVVMSDIEVKSGVISS